MKIGDRYYYTRGTISWAMFVLWVFGLVLGFIIGSAWRWP